MIKCFRYDRSSKEKKFWIVSENAHGRRDLYIYLFYDSNDGSMAICFFNLSALSLTGS